jgi:hypothetical protein
LSARIIQCNPDALAQLASEALCDGALKVMPAAFYRQFEQVDLAGFCLKQAAYCLPTFELLDKINELILEVSPTRSAIEIGSGNGVLGQALGIPCTDNYMQADAGIQAMYASAMQPVITYGAHVEKLDAFAAVKQYKPEVVVAAWVTHKYNPAEHWREGNMFGVDEKALLRRIKRYVFVGNLSPHGKKPLLAVPHKRIEVDYVFSRSLDAHNNAILVWESRNC